MKSVEKWSLILLWLLIAYTIEVSRNLIIWQSISFWSKFSGVVEILGLIGAITSIIRTIQNMRAGENLGSLETVLLVPLAPFLIFCSYTWSSWCLGIIATVCGVKLILYGLNDHHTKILFPS